MFSSITTSTKAIIQPPKISYYPQDLGSKLIIQNGENISREDFKFTTEDGFILLGSFYHNQTTPTNKCIVYLHAHGSSRLEAQSLLPFVFPGYNLCCFDARASGQSEGEYCTLGIKESEDLSILMHKLLVYFKQKQFYLWGRSMGAVTIILYLQKEQRQLVQGVVLDSPFTTTKTMVNLSL